MLHLGQKYVLPHSNGCAAICKAGLHKSLAGTMAHIRLYADDCILYRKVLDVKDIEKLHTDSDRLRQWAVANEMKQSEVLLSDSPIQGTRTRAVEPEAAPHLAHLPGAPATRCCSAPWSRVRDAPGRPSTRRAASRVQATPSLATGAGRLDQRGAGPGQIKSQHQQLDFFPSQQTLDWRGCPRWGAGDGGAMQREGDGAKEWKSRVIRKKRNKNRKSRELIL
jgi:hypothetical protein